MSQHSRTPHLGPALPSSPHGVQRADPLDPGGAGLAPASRLTLLSSGAGLGATVCSGRLSAQAGRVLGCPLLLRGLPAYWGRTGRPGHCRALLLTRLRHAPWGGGRVTSASGSTGHPAEPARLPTQTSCLCG